MQDYRGHKKKGLQRWEPSELVIVAVQAETARTERVKNRSTVDVDSCPWRPVHWVREREHDSKVSSLSAKHIVVIGVQNRKHKSSSLIWKKTAFGLCHAAGNADRNV